MKISLVTVSFNQNAYLSQALDSVLNQGFPDLEYIVVDPGSTDGSRETIARYSTRISRSILEPDRGAADGLNKGFQAATGEVFGFLNSDDMLLPGSLSAISNHFEANPACDIALGNGIKIDGGGKTIRHFKARNFAVNSYLYGGAVWLQQSTFFRAAIFNRSPKFNLDNRTCWDGELLVSMLADGAKVGYINTDLGCFRIHETSISGSQRLARQYRMDSRRIFRQIKGRSWSVQDDLLRILFRAVNFANRIRQQAN